MAQEVIGRTVDVVPAAGGVLVSLRYAFAVTFICEGDDTFTLKSATTYDGTPSPLAAITDYLTSPGDGSAAWTGHTQAAADSVTIGSGAAAFFVDAADLPAGSLWCSVTASDTGKVTAIFGDLQVQRDPASLPVRSGSGS